jgi:hypothetical protein
MADSKVYTQDILLCKTKSTTEPHLNLVEGSVASGNVMTTEIINQSAYYTNILLFYHVT